MKNTDSTDWLPYSWFVIELLVLYLVYWSVFRIKKISDECKIAISISIICLCYFLMVYLKLPIYLWRSTPAFALGLIYKLYESQILRQGKRMMLLVAIIALIQFAVANVLNFKELNFLFICVMVFGIFSLFQVKNDRLVLFFSKISFEMYLVQSIAIGAVGLLHLGSSCLYCLLVIALDIVLAMLLSKFSIFMKGCLNN